MLYISIRLGIELSFQPIYKNYGGDNMGATVRTQQIYWTFAELITAFATNFDKSGKAQVDDVFLNEKSVLDHFQSGKYMNITSKIDAYLIQNHSCCMRLDASTCFEELTNISVYLTYSSLGSLQISIGNPDNEAENEETLLKCLWALGIQLSDTAKQAGASIIYNELLPSLTFVYSSKVGEPFEQMLKNFSVIAKSLLR